MPKPCFEPSLAILNAFHGHRPKSSMRARNSVEETMELMARSASSYSVACIWANERHQKYIKINAKAYKRIISCAIDKNVL